MPHSLFECLGQLLVAALEQDLNVGRRLLIFLLSAEAFDARAKTAFQMVFETRPRQFAVDLDLAGAKLERAIYEIRAFCGRAIAGRNGP